MDRQSLLRVPALGLLLGTLSAAAPAWAGQACVGSPSRVFSLAIAPGAMQQREADRIRVEVHGDGCVAVRRPWFLRDAGWHEVRLDPAEWRSLQGAIDAKRLNGLSQDALGDELAAAKSTGLAPDGGEVAVHELDSDLHVLGWRDGGRWRELVVDDPLGAAESLPKATSLAAFARAVRALQSLAARQGARRDGGSTP